MELIKKYFTLQKLLEKEKQTDSCPDKKEMKKKYWEMALPASLEGIFINLILLCDLVMVGKLGIAKAAAVGIVSQPKMIMQMIGKSLGVGVSAVVSRRKGEKNYQTLNSVVKQSFLLTSLIYLILVSFAIAFRKDILVLMGANKEYLDYAVDYFTYLILALFFKALSAILSSVQVGLGNTKVILKASVTGNLFNLFLNYCLIFGKFNFPRLEIKGAAIATIIGEFVIFLILLISLFSNKNKDELKLKSLGTFRFKRNTMRPVLEISTNSFLEHIFERLGLFIFARLIAELGTVAVGVHHYCIIIWDLYYYFGLGMGTAIGSIVGRKLGEKRKNLAIIYTALAKKSAFFISLFVSVFILIFRREILSILLTDISAISLASNIMLIVAILIIPQTQAQVLTATLRGAGDNRFIAKYSLFVSAILRSILAYLFAFVFNLNLYGIWLALMIDEILKMIFSSYRISKGIWLSKEI